MRKQWLFIILWIAIYIAIRSVHFIDALNFSQDQAADSLKGLQILRNHTFTLIGTHTGYSYQGRLLFQGPLFIYTYLIFNLLGNFDPVRSSYIFTLVGSVSIVPLYFAVKKLGNERAAQLAVIFYSLLPYFIDYSRFLWNPNFQFVTTPYVLYAFARYHESKKKLWLFATTTLAGLLLQHHYQYVLVLASLFAYFCLAANKKTTIPFFIFGIILGFFPVIMFEFRHNFYNLQTALLFIQHYQEVFFAKNGASVSPHFFLSSALLLIVYLLIILKKYLTPLVTTIILLLLCIACLPYFKQPDRMFNSRTPWKYEYEQRVYDVVSHYNLSGAAISNLTYDNEAMVQRFFLARDHKDYVTNYYENTYLFAVLEPSQLSAYHAYEITTFLPRTIVKSWHISPRYQLYLLKRGEKHI